jgi:hypothetical protein
MTEPTAIVKDMTRSHPGVTGPAFNPASARRTIALARSRGQKALLVAIRRLTKYVTDPSTPIDSTFIRVFRELADRTGMPRVSVSASEVNATVTTNVDVAVEALRRRLAEAELLRGRPILAEVKDVTPD